MSGRSWPRAWPFGGVLVATLAILWLLLGVPASAHALLTSSDPSANSVLPRPPAQATLTFIEPIEPLYSEVKLFDADGKPVQTEPSRLESDSKTMILPLPANLPDGTYTLQWKNISKVDGHLVTGYVPFTIGNAASVTTPAVPALVAAANGSSSGVLDTLGRWLGLLGVVALAGAVLGWPLVLRSAVADLPEPALAATTRRLALLSVMGTMVALAGSVLLLAAQTEHSAGTIGFAAMTRLLGSTRFGWFWVARVVLLVLAGALAWRPAVWSRRRRWPTRLAALLAAAALLPYALISHAAAQEAGSPAAVSADWLHLLGTAVWLGGLAAMLAALIFNRAIPADRRRPVYAGAIRRFSTVALASVLLLVLTGLYAAWLEVGSLEALRSTSYGHALDVKLLLLVPLLALAGYNLRVIGPAMLSAPSAAAGFARTVVGEAVLGMVLLLVVGVLIGLPTARESRSLPADHPVMRFDRSGVSAVLQLTPGTVGLNRYTVDVTLHGRPLPQTYNVLLDVSSNALNGVREIDLQRDSSEPNRWEAQGSELSVTGEWQVKLIVRPPDVDDWGAIGTLDIQRVFTPTPAAPVSRFQGYTAALLVLLTGLGAVLVVVGLRTGGPRETRRLLLEAGAGLIVIGGVSLLLTLGSGGAAAAGSNPAQPTSDSISRGRDLLRPAVRAATVPTSAATVPTRPRSTHGRSI